MSLKGKFVLKASLRCLLAKKMSMCYVGCIQTINYTFSNCVRQNFRGINFLMQKVSKEVKVMAKVPSYRICSEFAEKGIDCMLV